MALGARTGDVLQIVLKQSLKSVGIGAGLGLAGALAATRFLSSLLYEVEPTDLTTYCVITALLLSVAFVAAYLPARKALKMDPTSALKLE